MKPKWLKNKKSIEAELKQCFALYKASWESAEREQRFPQKKLGNCPRAATKKSELGTRPGKPCRLGQRERLGQ